MKTGASITQRDLEKGYQSTATLAKIFIVALIGLAPLMEIALRSGLAPDDPAPAATLSTLRYAFLGISLVDFLVLGMIKRQILSASTTTGTDAGVPGPIAKLKNAALVGYAISMTPAVLGIVLFALGGNRVDFYLFFIVSLFFFNSEVPKFERWKAWIQSQGIKIEG